MEKSGVWIVVGMVILVIAISSQRTEEPRTEIKVDWQADYRSKLPENIANEKYIQSTDIFDYNNPEVISLAEQIKLQSNNPREAVQNTLDWVYKYIRYNSYEGNDVCYRSSASKVVKAGIGQCDTQSMVAIAVVRKLGIAVRPMGGCLYNTHNCDFKFSIMSTVGIKPRMPKYSEVDLSNPEVIPRAGGLHLWSEYFDVDKQEWVIMEATSGKIVDDQYCFSYLTEMEIDNGDTKHYCTSTDYSFAQQCAARK